MKKKKNNWECYPDKERDNILHSASSRSGIMKYLREQKLMRDYKKGIVRVAEIIWEK